MREDINYDKYRNVTQSQTPPVICLILAKQLITENYN